MDNKELNWQFEKMRTGDKQAFTFIYNELKIPVYAIICRIVRGEAISKDVMHDVFVKLFTYPQDAKIANPRAWIFQIARNLAIDSIRKLAVNAELPEDAEDLHEPLEESVTLRLDIKSALQRLPLKEFEIVMMHIHGGLKFKEISDILNIPAGTVYWKYQKAISNMRTYLKEGVL